MKKMADLETTFCLNFGCILGGSRVFKDSVTCLEHH